MRIRLLVYTVVLSLFLIYTPAEALLHEGEAAPDFLLRDLDGNPVQFSKFSDKKVVIILFWSTWSVNSPKALKRFDDFYRKYGGRGIQVIGINADNQAISREDMDSIKKVTKELNISFPIFLDAGLKTFHLYDVIALPSTIVTINGKVSYGLPGLPLVGTEDMFDYLLVLAGEPPRKKPEPRYVPRYDAIADANLARQFVKKSQYEMAYLFFQKAIGKDPKYIPPYVELAKLYRLEGKNTDAENILRKALSVESDNVAAVSELGYLLAKTGRTDEALVLLDRATGMDSYTPAHYYRAYALAKNGKVKEALESFDKAISLNPYDSSIYLLRAEIYESKKMTKEAAADYRKALELLLSIR
ncbi:MAG: redoxin domain-containing protein [Nitrospirae bacterium]|nr:redoxin domain-containing protein [Nitrospirota bacterium]